MQLFSALFLDCDRKIISQCLRTKYTGTMDEAVETILKIFMAWVCLILNCYKKTKKQKKKLATFTHFVFTIIIH